MVGGEADGQWLEQALDEPDRCGGASDVFEQQHPPAGSEHPPCLCYRRARVGDRAEAEGADDGVEALVGEVERLHVAELKPGGATELLRAAAPEGEHLRAELDSGQRDVGGIEGQVAGGAGGEHLPARLLADPAAAVREQHALEERDLAVVAGRVAVLVLSHPLRLGGVVERSAHAAPAGALAWAPTPPRACSLSGLLADAASMALSSLSISSEQNSN